MDSGQKTPPVEDCIGLVDGESQNLNLKFESMSQNVETELQYKSKNFLELDSSDEGEGLKTIASVTSPRKSQKSFHRQSTIGFRVSAMGLNDSRVKVDRDGGVSQLSGAWTKKHAAGVKDYNQWRKMPVSQQLMAVNFLSRVASRELNQEITAFNVKNMT